MSAEAKSTLPFQLSRGGEPKNLPHHLFQEGKMSSPPLRGSQRGEALTASIENDYDRLPE
jgi:hypothetical protein